MQNCQKKLQKFAFPGILLNLKFSKASSRESVWLSRYLLQTYLLTNTDNPRDRELLFNDEACVTFFKSFSWKVTTLSDLGEVPFAITLSKSTFNFSWMGISILKLKVLKLPIKVRYFVFYVIDISIFKKNFHKNGQMKKKTTPWFEYVSPT